MSSVTTDTKRIPWKFYLKSQLLKLFGFLVLAILVIVVMIVSADIDLETATSADPIYLFAVALSSICFILVLIAKIIHCFSKIILFDMAAEFGLRDENTQKMKYNLRFFLFASLALSFCSAIYLLLDVFLQETYLELLPVLLMDWVLVSTGVTIPGLTDLGRGRVFYQTARNIYFDFFFLVIITFSVLVFLAILTSLGRKRVISRFQKEEVVDEEEENKKLYKLLIWFAIPIINSFLLTLFNTSVGPIFIIIFFLLLIWWFYQLIKVIFLIFWRGFKITAFITSVNALLIIPLVAILYLLPVVSWTIWDIFAQLREATITLELDQLIQASLIGLQSNFNDFLRIIQLDYVFITIIATFIVGFAEGFALIAIFSAITRGVEVARTGRVLVKSPPKVAVFTKYLVMLSIWLGIFWDSFIQVWNMIIDNLNIQLPRIEIPSFFYTIYNEVILPLSDSLEQFIPTLQYIPILIIPLYFILAGAFKFLSVTIITPRVKDNLSTFFLLISTAFVLIITNILGDILEIQNAPGFTGIQDAPLQSFNVLSTLIIWVVEWFEYIESIAFYCGLGFGIYWVTSNYFKKRKDKKAEFAPKESKKPEESKIPKKPVDILEDKVELSDRKSTVSIESIKEAMKPEVQPAKPIDKVDD